MNNDNSQGVVFGGQPINNLVPPVDAGANSTLNATAPNVINEPVSPIPMVNPTGMVTPVMNENVGPMPVNNVNDLGVMPTNSIIDNSANAMQNPVNSNAGVGIISSPINSDLISVTPDAIVPTMNSENNMSLNVANPNNTIENNIPNTLNNMGSVSGVTAINPMDTNNGVPPVNPGTITPEQSNMNNTVNQQSDILGFDLPSNTSVVQASPNPSVEAVAPAAEAMQTTVPSNETMVSNTSDENVVVSVGTYLGYMFLAMIPVVGIIVLIMKALNKKDKAVANFAKAQLLFTVIISVLVGVLGTVAVKMFPTDTNNTGSYTVDYTYD